MNIKHYFVVLGCAAAFLATSCTGDDAFENISTPQQREVRFQTSISTMSRSVTTASSLGKFKTTAFLRQEGMTTRFMDDVTVENVNGVWETPDAYMWPYNGTLTFYSVAPVALPLSVTGPDAAPTFVFTAESDAAMQTDVLYAVNADHQYTGSAASSIVNVNFRHALSQVVFKAKCENENWQVDISDVKIHNLRSSGTYSMPLQTTSPLQSSDDVRGSWALASDMNTYNTGIPEPKKNISGDVVELTSSSVLPLLLLPQTTSAWEPKSDPKCENRGSYFTIRCQLRQKTADGSYIIIWPSSGNNAYVDVAIPVAVNWDEGMKYTYVFNFKDGAGFIPPSQTGGGDDVLPGNPVLTPVSFSVSIDKFEEDATEIKM